MKNTLPTEKDCKRVSTVFNNILQHIFEYAHRKKMDKEPFETYYQMEDEWKDYPPAWEDTVLGMIAAVPVTAYPKKVRAFIRSKQDSFTKEEFALVKRWKTHPWFYCAFTVTKDFEGYFLEIKPLGDSPRTWQENDFPETLLLFSRSITDSYRHGKKTFITLLWEGEKAFHTYGVILSFDTINETDILYFTDFIRNRNCPSSECPLKGRQIAIINVSDTILVHQFSFLKLIKLSSIPEVTTHGKAITNCISIGTVSDIDNIKNEKAWEKAAASAGEEFQGAVFAKKAAAIYIGQGVPMHDVAIYFSYETYHVFLHAFTEEAYQKGREICEQFFSFPEKPQIKASMVIISAALSVDAYKDEFTQLREYFESINQETDELEDTEIENTHENVPTKEQSQAIMNRLVENHNNGIEENDTQVAEALGVDTEMVTPLREQLLAVFERQEKTKGKPADRFGLSPRAFMELTKGGVPHVEGVLRVRTPEQIQDAAFEKGIGLQMTLALSPAFRFARWLVDKVVTEGSLPATQAGYVGTKLIQEAYEKHIIPTPADRYTKSFTTNDAAAKARQNDFLLPKKESDWHEFIFLRKLLETCSLLSYNGKRFIPGNKAEEIIKDPAVLYYHLLEIMFTTYEWDYSHYAETIPYLRSLSGFLFYAIETLTHKTPEHNKSDKNKKINGWADIEDITDRFIAAIPSLATYIKENGPYENPNDNSIKYISIEIQKHFIDKFAQNFGLIEVRTKENSLFIDKVRPTDLFSIVFES